MILKPWHVVSIKLKLVLPNKVESNENNEKNEKNENDVESKMKIRERKKIHTTYLHKM